MADLASDVDLTRISKARKYQTELAGCNTVDSTWIPIGA